MHVITCLSKKKELRNTKTHKATVEEPFGLVEFNLFPSSNKGMVQTELIGRWSPL